jgi:hypothetical protein
MLYIASFITGINFTVKLILADQIDNFHGPALILALGSCCSPGTTNAVLVASLIPEVRLQYTGFSYSTIQLARKEEKRLHGIAGKFACLNHRYFPLEVL